tara:strand:- start:1167 stop:1442 length:276 start_codon:yes stop_codon:yes gene_type:complete
MTQTNENEALGTDEPCIEVTDIHSNSAHVKVSKEPSVTLVWVKGEGAGRICLTYWNGQLKDITVYNGKMSKKTRTDKAGNSHVDLKFRGDF